MANGKRKVLNKEHRDQLVDVLTKVHPRFGESSNGAGFASGPATVKGELPVSRRSSKPLKIARSEPVN